MSIKLSVNEEGVLPQDIIAYGNANLIGLSKDKTRSNYSLTYRLSVLDKDNSIMVNINNHSRCQISFTDSALLKILNMHAGKNFTFSFKEAHTERCEIVVIYRESGSDVFYGEIGKNSLTFSTDPQKTIIEFIIRPYAYSGTGTITETKTIIEDMQLTMSDDVIPYTPYSTFVYTVNSDGTVDNVKSIYPRTVLLPLTSDDSDITIEANYNRDINKAFNEVDKKITKTANEVRTEVDKKITETANEVKTEFNAVKNNFSGALRGEASGKTAIALKDISEVEHDVKLKVTSKNLLDIVTAPEVYMNTYTWEKTDTGFIATSTVNSDSSWTRHAYNLGKSEDLKGKTFTVSADYKTTTNGTPVLMIHNADKQSGDTSSYKSVSLGSIKGTTLTVTIPNNLQYEYINVLFYFTNGAPIKIGDIVEYSNIQVEEGTVATDYVPYDISGTKLKAYGGNLLDLTSPITFQRCRKNDDGTITCRVSGESGYCQLKTTSLNEVLQTLDGHKITFSMRSIPSDGYMSIVIFYTDGTYKEARSRIGINSCTLALNHQGKTVDRLQLRPLLRGIKFTDTTTIFRDIQLEIDGASKYMPYIAPIEYAANQAFIPSIYPSMTLISDTEGVNIKAEYNRDITNVIACQQSEIDELRAMILELKTN